MEGKWLRKILAVTLAMTLLIPQSFLASAQEDPTALGESGREADLSGNGTITAFAALDPETAYQSLVPGEDADPELPDALGAELDSADLPEVVEIPVEAWESDPAYNRLEAGAYVFTPIIGNRYAVAEGVARPTITVELAAGVMALRSDTAMIDVGAPAQELIAAAGASGGMWDYNSDIITIHSGPVQLTGSSSERAVKVDGGARVTLVDLSLENASGSPLSVESGADAAFILNGASTLYGKMAGLLVRAGASVTIEAGTGAASLKAEGSDFAGIGGWANQTAGEITIESGTVTASCVGSYGAGIGGSYGANSRVTINGGTVVATGGSGAAGIGGGYDGAGGIVLITGGHVTAYGGEGAPGIGPGDFGHENGDYEVTITGGTVYAYGGTRANSGGGAGIGSGNQTLYGGNSILGKINITGGTVYASGGGGAAGIGGGRYNNGTDVTISGPDTTVVAKGNGAPDVGSGGNKYNGGSLNVEDGATLELAGSGTNADLTIDEESTLAGNGVKAIALTVEGNGTVTAHPNPAPQGATVTLTATPGDNDQWTGWETSPTLAIADKGNGTHTFTMPSVEVSIKAVFTGNAVYSKDDVTKMGNIIRNNGLNGYDPDDPATWTFATWENNEGTLVLTEVDLSGSSLSGDVEFRSYSSLRKLDVSDCKSLTSITGFMSRRLGTILVSGCDNLQMVDCSYTAATSFDLTNLPSLRIFNCNNAPLVRLDTTGSHNLREFNVTGNAFLKIGEADHGNVEITGYFYSNKTVTLQAVPDESCEFLQWVYDPEGEYPATDNPASFDLKSNRTLTVTPEFAPVAVVDAQTPRIITHPLGGDYHVNDEAAALAVEASVDDGGTLSYQWFQNTSNATTGGELVGEDILYIPSTEIAGTYYYYVVVTNTNSKANGATIATATSNTARVVVEEPVITYRVTVVNGSGSGDYQAGETVAITANPAPEGKVFDRWIGAVVFENAGNVSTSFAMPEANVTVTATYKDEVVEPQTYTLTVVNGTGSGDYTSGEQVTITANTAPKGKVFDRWVGGVDFADAGSVSTSFLMPAANTVVTANYRDEDVVPETYTLTVVNGSGSGEYRSGQVVSITADEAPKGKVFDRWVGSASFGNAERASTNLEMPAANTTVTATYRDEVVEPETYRLTVVNGSGSGEYESGARVSIAADEAPVGKVFDRWVGGVEFADAGSVSTSFLMPAANTTVTATYRDEIVEPETYTLTVVNGSGSGDYESGARVSIAADAAPVGKVFDRWVGGVEFADAGSVSTSFVMPAANTTVTATYRDEIVEPETYRLTVVNGSGSGDYESGARVNIAADAAPAGKVFDRWVGSVEFADAGSVSTSFVMPAANTTVTATYRDEAPGPIPAVTYTLTVAAGVGGSVDTGVSGDYEAGTEIGLTAAADSYYRFSGWSSSDGGAFVDAGNASTIFTMPSADTTVTAIFTNVGGPSPNGGASRGGSGSSRSDSSSSRAATSAAGGASAASAATLTMADARSAFDSVLADAVNGTATLRLVNVASLPLDVLRSIADWAAQADVHVIIHADTVVDRVVTARLYIDPALATGDIRLQASTGTATANNVRSLFQRHFDNRVEILHLEQSGSFGSPVQVAARLNLVGFDADELVFYSYDKASNRYRRIASPDHWVDRNGYLHFITEGAGDIVVSDGLLTAN